MRKTFTPPIIKALAGSAEEDALFQNQQRLFVQQFEHTFPDKLAPRTVVVVPSLTLDQAILQSVKGALHYEERMLCLLLLLRMPLTKIIYVTSTPIAECIIDYYLHMLPGITGHHARKRLCMLSCYDASAKSLTEKILERPRLLGRIKSEIGNTSTAHLTCFTGTTFEKTLAVALGIPLFGTDPAMFYNGTKSGSRKLFKACNVPLPFGFEDLRSQHDIATAIAALKLRYPATRKAVVKMNDGFSGDGNAIYRFDPTPEALFDAENILASLHERLSPVATNLTPAGFFAKFESMGGIVELFVEGNTKSSPSVQCVINPNGAIDIVSTHDQLLGGKDQQVFEGALFPASPAYAAKLAEESKKIALELAQKGALGRIAVDFISVLQADDTWQHYAIEINIRKGGTTHPYLMLKFLTDGAYNANTGKYLTASGNERFYLASDNVENRKFVGLTPEDLIEIVVFHDLMFAGASQEGVMFHLLGALSEFGKLGMVCIGSSPERAKQFYDRTLEILDAECH